ncbi:unnamed protein product, partial [Rotaria magnacalcarata]
MGNITIEDQSNIGSSTLNKVDSEHCYLCLVNLGYIKQKKFKEAPKLIEEKLETLFNIIIMQWEKPTLNAADDTQLINTFVNGFKELCYWLRNLLVKGEIVAMGDIK